jgi:hypothetical protein
MYGSLIPGGSYQGVKIITLRFGYQIMVESESQNYTTPCMTVHIAGFLFAGILIFFMGVHYTNQIWEFMPIDTYAYNVVKMVLSIIVLIYAAYALRNMVFLEGLVLFLIGISSLSFAVTYLIYCQVGLSIIDLTFGFAMLVIAMQLWRNKDWVLFISVVTSGIGFIFSGLLTSWPIEGVMFLFSGIMMSSYAALQLMAAEISPNAVDHNPVHVIITESVGMFVLGITCLIVGIWYLDSVIALSTAGYNSYNIAKIILSVSVLMLSFCAIREGEFAIGVPMMLFGVSALSFSLSQLIFGESDVELVDVIFGVVFFISAVTLYFRGEKLKSVGVFLLFFAITFYPLFGGDAKYYVIGIPFVVAALIFLLSSVKFSSQSGLKPLLK